MLKALTCSLLASIVALMPSYVAADQYDEWLQGAESELRLIVQLQSALIKSKSDSRLLLVFGSADVEVRKVGLPSPFVTKKSGQRPRITLPAEFLLLLKFIGDASVIPYNDGELYSCATGYMDRLRSRLAENGIRAARNQPLLRLIAPEEYAKAVGLSCRRFAERFPIAFHERMRRDQAIRSVVAFAWLHEYGHLALQHSPINSSVQDLRVPAEERMTLFLKAMRSSRQQETAAAQRLSPEWEERILIWSI